MTKIKKDYLRLLFDRLRDSYRIIGPRKENDVIILSEIDFNDIPAGYRDIQGPGTYRLNPPESGGERTTFSFSVGPDSFKRFLRPPHMERLFTFKKSKRGISINPSIKEEKPLAFVGARACDIAALKKLDKVFLEGVSRDTSYSALRKDLLIIGVNCIYPGNNCFCHSMETGPELKDIFDIAITELDGYFILEAGTAMGEKIMDGLPSEKINNNDIEAKNSAAEHCIKMMKKSVRLSELPRVIYRNLEHPRWSDIAGRDLECGNCTQVCPTCFCNSSFDYMLLQGISKKATDISGVKVRTWDSCFSTNFARVHGGNFRPSRRARYRHWMSHKLAYSIEQHGSSDCVGCGRCITWCPAGINITEELKAIRKETVSSKN